MNTQMIISNETVVNQYGEHQTQLTAVPQLSAKQLHKITPYDYEMGENPVNGYLLSLEAASSQKTMERALQLIVNLVWRGTPYEGNSLYSFPFHRMDDTTGQGVKNLLAAHFNKVPSSVNKHLSAYRRVLRKCYLLGHMSNDAYRRATSDISNLKGTNGDAGRSLNEGEFIQLLNACKQNANGVRNATIIVVLYYVGLRRDELVNLKTNDIDRENNEIIVRQGKGNKSRKVSVMPEVVYAIDDWLTGRDSESEYLFVGTHAHNKQKQLSAMAIYMMLKETAKRAGVKHFSPHDMRRSYATESRKKGIDITDICTQMGHSNISTTMRYMKDKHESAKESVAKRPVLYQRRVLSVG